MKTVFLNHFPLRSPTNPHLHVAQLGFGGECFMTMSKMIVWLEVLSVGSEMVTSLWMRGHPHGPYPAVRPSLCMEETRTREYVPWKAGVFPQKDRS